MSISLQFIHITITTFQKSSNPSVGEEGVATGTFSRLKMRRRRGDEVRERARANACRYIFYPRNSREDGRQGRGHGEALVSMKMRSRGSWV
jgi:hypothetical protein